MEKLQKLITALNDKHLEDIIALDMRNHSPLYDFMIISTAKNDRIISGVLRELKDLSDQPGFDLKFIEGHNGGHWVLADFGEMIVHVFNEEMRTRYHLEKLWGDAHQVEIDAWLS